MDWSPGDGGEADHCAFDPFADGPLVAPLVAECWGARLGGAAHEAAGGECGMLADATDTPAPPALAGSAGGLPPAPRKGAGPAGGRAGGARGPPGGSGSASASRCRERLAGAVHDGGGGHGSAAPPSHVVARALVERVERVRTVTGTRKRLDERLDDAAPHAFVTPKRLKSMNQLLEQMHFLSAAQQPEHRRSGPKDFNASDGTPATSTAGPLSP